MWHAGGMNCARKLIRRRAIRVSAVKPYGVGRLLATTQLAESFVTNLQLTRDVNFAEVQNFTALWADPLSTEPGDGWLIEWLELGILVPPEGWENDPVYRRSWVPGGMEEFLQRVGECQWRTAMMRDSLEHACRMLQLELQPTPKRCLNASGRPRQSHSIGRKGRYRRPTPHPSPRPRPTQPGSNAHFTGYLTHWCGLQRTCGLGQSSD